MFKSPGVAADIIQETEKQMESKVRFIRHSNIHTNMSLVIILSSTDPTKSSPNPQVLSITPYFYEKASESNQGRHCQEASDN